MRKNIESLINSGITAHQVASDTGIPRNTAYRIFSGEANIDNITLKNAEILSNYWEEIKMTKQIEQAIEYGLSIDWVKAVTGEDTESAAIEELAEMYVDTDLTVEQFVFAKLNEDGRVKDDDAFDDESEANAEGYYWYDEVGKWIDLE